MPEAQIHRIATWAELGLAVVTFVSLLFITAPYGRHSKTGFGPAIPQRAAWIAMELPAVVVWLAIYLLGRNAFQAAPLAMLGIWQAHYLQRTFVFPFRIRSGDKTTPLGIVASAIVFNTLNAYVNARWVSELGSYTNDWLTSPVFVVGVVLFGAGLFANITSDGILIRLRSTSTSYAIPRGGLFRWVSCPNYLAEMLEWTGWAILTWSLAGTAFAIYTAANLVPRALSHHRWYKERFPDYPRGRRALIPFVW